ncbi:50S ribosomal protein L22 [Patescibacteria group bacterium]|nr:50S ribosomal protein L22 [Patescibacteria group bacterium]
MQEVTAKLKYLRIAPRKVRLLADLVRGMSLKEAKIQMDFNKKKAGGPFLKLLKSAESNAQRNFKLDTEGLYIKEIKVDEGPMLKRYMPRARGRATVIRRRSSHISLVLGERLKKIKKSK